MIAALRIPVLVKLLETSVLSQMQYRLDFILEMFMAVFWVGWNVAPLFVVFEVRPDISAFSFEQAMLVMSAFLILKALMEGLVSPNLLALVEHIRKGTLDFVLLKPVDSQLLASTSRILPSKLIYLAGGAAMAIWSVAKLASPPSALDLLLGLAMLASGAAILYGTWLVIICSAFWFVRMDNLAYLFNSVFDAARWPIGVFRGWVRVVLTWILPIAVMTSHPARAVLGRLEASDALAAGVAAIVFLIGSRFLWMRAVAHYSSASS